MHQGTHPDIGYDITCTDEGQTSTSPTYRGKRVKIIRCKDNKIKWTIPNFPVMNINFQVIEIEGPAPDTRNYGLMKVNDASKITRFPLIVECCSFCNIQIDRINYLVLWEWSTFESVSEDQDPSQAISDSSASQDAADSNVDCLSLLSNLLNQERQYTTDTCDSPPVDSESDDSTDSDDNCEHELPFKVMGVTHVPMRQTHLMWAHENLEKGNDVEVKIRPDPDNHYDSNAIAVEINYGSGWNVVGFILRELTQFIHPVLQRNKLSGQRIGHIRFRTHWSTPGFYILIYLKCKGMWPREVIKASKRVR